PHGTDVIEATAIAEGAVERAVAEGARVILLPTIPFGNNAQQQDQVATIHLSTTTALAVLRDVTASLVRQGIDRLVILNGHGGNAFAPLVRDVMLETGATIVVVNFWQLAPETTQAIFDNPGDHAGDLETSLVLFLQGDLVEMKQAGDGRRVPFAIDKIAQPGVWTPRPWSQSHPDTGCGGWRGRSVRGLPCTARTPVVLVVITKLTHLATAWSGLTPLVGRAAATQKTRAAKRLTLRVSYLPAKPMQILRVFAGCCMDATRAG
ncbi:MAG: creatininase family protein, partial [Planctomycetia bacterium]|nr:creatininase family protein [Planctomycetia bacterium]